MRKVNYIRMTTAGLIFTTILAMSACNRSTSSIPETSTDAVVETSSETGTVETSGENLVSDETDKEQTTTEKASSSADRNDASTEARATTKASTESDTTSKASEQTTQASTTKAAAGNTTETTTQKQTEKATEKTTETTTQKQTERTTEKATEAHKHNYTSSVTKASTCTSEGVMTYRCSCGDSYTEAIGKTDHSFGGYTYNNDATYESDGTETAVCSVCGERTTRTAGGTKLVHVHSYAETVTTAPTCTTDGVKTFACSCGSSYTETIPATGHQFSDYTYNNDATTSADGTQTRYCLVCGETETVTAEGTRKSLPSWYDEHSETLNTTMGGQSDGSLEAYYVSGQFSWTDATNGCWDLGYSAAEDTVGEFAEGWVHHGYLYK